jgi:hypothetical protein
MRIRDSFGTRLPPGPSPRVRSIITDRRLILGLLALNTLLKCTWLGVNELSGDEPFTVFWATRPFAEFASMLRTENNPPMFFLLIKAWTHCVPLEEAWLRVPSALFSVLTVWPLFLLARRLGNGQMALVACLLFTLNNHQYAFAHEVRGYSLLLLLTALAAWLVVRGPGGSAVRSTALLAAVFTAVAWTHFFGWLVIGLLGVCVMVFPELREERRRVLLASIIAIVAFLPYGFIFFQRAGESIAHGTWVDPHGPEEIWHMVRRWSNQPVVTLLLVVPLLLVLVRERLRPYALRFALLWWLLPLLGLWLVQWWVPAYVDRYLLFASIGFYLAAGYALTNLVSKGWSRWVATVIAVAAMAFTFTPWRDNGQYPSHVAAQVRAWQRSPEVPPVLVRPFWYKTTLWAYMDRSREGKAPWLQAWSENYNDAQGLMPIDEADELILVYTAATEESGPRPMIDGFHHMEEQQADGLVRVARYAR